jgi:hypothetical protein
MRLSGIDPSIIRELSGIYKPFVKAFKELISNAYDADATAINIAVARDFSSIAIQDNGIGLTPIEFRRDFARLGGSTAWQNRGRSPGGRLRIGYKGIGFLAVARYCSRMEIESASSRTIEGSALVRVGRRRQFNISELLQPLIPSTSASPRLRVNRVQTRGARTIRLKAGKDYSVRKGILVLASKRALSAQQLEIRYALSCGGLLLRAALDFDYLLSLERRADLHLLEDFCEVEVTAPTKQPILGTTIRLIGLKDFVVRELAAPRHRGKSVSIGSRSGKEQFLWRIARSAPIDDWLPTRDLPEPLSRMRSAVKRMNLPKLSIQWRDEAAVEVTRTVALPAPTAPDDAVLSIQVNEGGLRASGYLLAQDTVLFPAELRGISVRVRNVAIGEPSFFGLEQTLVGARKAALSQMSGEVIVLEGLEAADAINPGRESFYEENDHYRTLKRTLVGSSDDVLSGIVGQAIRLITDRGNIRGQVGDKIGAARQRRRVLTDISSAIQSASQADAEMAKRLTEFLHVPTIADGLATAKEVVLRPVGRLAGFEIEEVPGLAEEFAIDFGRRVVAVDFTREIWSQSIYVHGKYFEVCFRQGQAADSMCEFDTVEGRIHVNWAHPVKLYMDDLGFLRTAIVWRLAYHLANESAETMIKLALPMLAHRAD